MAFCKYCGTQLNEGEVCSCEAAQAERASAEAVAPQANAAAPQVQAAAPQADAVAPQAETAAPQAETAAPQADATAPQAETAAPQANAAAPQAETAAPQQSAAQQAAAQAAAVAGEKAKGLWQYLLKMLMAPVTAGAEYVQNGKLVDSICFVVIQAVLAGFFGLTIIGKINRTLGLGGAFFDSYKFSGAAGFFLTLLFALLFSVLFGAIFWLGCKILKVTLSLEQTLGIMAVRSVFSLIITVLAILVALVNPAYGFGIYYLAGLLVLCILMGIVKQLPEMNENKAAYMMFVVSAVFVIIAVFIMSKAVTLYIPSSIKERAGDLTNLLNFM